METLPRPAPDRALPFLYLLCSIVSAALGLNALVGSPCRECAGGLLLVFPWVGAAYYGTLALLALRRPASRLLTHLLGLTVSLHCALLLESLILQRLCIGCLALALLALGTSFLQARRRPEDRLTLVAALVLGSLAGLVQPADRLDDALTRAFWPSRILSQAPSFVDSAELARCEHPSSVRLLLYEDKKLCKSCSRVARVLLPEIQSEFGSSVCVHRHVLEGIPEGHRLPAWVLSSRTHRLVVVEGTPESEELRRMLRTLVADAR